MKKQIIAGLLAATALLSFGCSGRNAEFGVVDMHAVESKAAVVKTVPGRSNNQRQSTAG